jgi:S-DNA-T family DNA segregation ATPase FtsK/SpoIIIE
VRFVVTLRDGRAAGTETEALIDAAPDTSLLTLMPQLLQALDDDIDPTFAHRVPIWVDGVAVPPDRNTLRSAEVRPGSVVELHAREEQPARTPSGVAELHVVNGPGAGRVHRLGLGRTVVGHDAPGLSLPDDRLAADALTIITRPGGQAEVEVAAGTTATIDGTELEGRAPWPPGTYLVSGDSVLELTEVSEADGDSRQEDGELGVDFVRHQRSSRNRSAPRFVLPARPAPNNSGQARDQRRALAEWRQDRDGAQAEVLASLARETRERRDATPDPALTLLTAVGPGHRLWERLPLDDDWLQLRLGLAAQPPRTVIEDLDGGGPVRVGPTRWHTEVPEPLPALLPDVPVTLNLQAVGLLGIVGQASTTNATARWLLAQCATFHAPHELRIAVLTAHDYAARRRWEWVSRLPHARPDESSGVTVLIGNDRESVEQRLSELNQLVAARTEARKPGGPAVASIPEVVVVLDGMQRLSSVNGVAGLVARGQEAGVHVICLDADPSALPDQCRAIVTCSPGRLAFRRADSPVLDGIRPDLVESAWADRLSRALAPLRLSGPPGSGGARSLDWPDGPTPLDEPRAWPIAWDDVGYPAPTR